MIVLNDLFDYGAKIYQDTEFFKFSIDSILLAEFIKIKKGAKILDMCSGNAPVSLILATKEKNLEIDAVEIQEIIYNLADKSIKENHLENIIKVHNRNILDFYPKKEYDIVAANPPYFKISETSEKNDNEVKRIARHEVTITLEQVIASAKRLLKSNGTFYMVNRIDRFLETIEILTSYKFGIRKVAFIYTKNNSNAEFFIIEAALSKKSDLKVTSINIKNLKTYKNIFKER